MDRLWGSARYLEVQENFSSFPLWWGKRLQSITENKSSLINKGDAYHGLPSEEISSLMNIESVKLISRCVS